MLSMHGVLSKMVGTDKDIQYGTDNEFWIGVYDKPYYNSRIRVYCNCLGGIVLINLTSFLDLKISSTKMI